MTTGTSSEVSEEFYKKMVRAWHQFTVKELKHLLETGNECFPSVIKSAQVMKIITVNRLEPNKVNYINVLDEFLRKCKLTQDACIKHLQHLCFQDVILHKKKTWKTIELLDPADPNKLNLTEAQIKANILRKIKAKLQSNAIIQIQNVNNINWCMLIEVKYNKRGTPRYGVPSYFSYTDDQSSLCLCTNKMSALIDVLVESFGYSDFKNCDLNGKDVRTLHALVSKRRGSTDGSTPSTPTTDANLSRTSRNRFLSPRNIVMQEVQVKCHTEWKGSRVNKKRKKLNSVNSMLKIQAPNIGLVIQSLIDQGVIVDPNAAWVTKLRTTTSNVIDVDTVAC
ncbi:hypothetical protein M8J76_011644 [Diaphorina citri]|nr:hypothetical protein M8J75_002883 [Diaphorina citri]KAI5737264.1 hypothetical protein M8J76_011644 [Diaphorina citri]